MYTGKALLINIISLRQNKHQSPGPNKVFTNTTKGLNLIKYPFVVNKHLNSTKRVWLQWGREPLEVLHKAKSKVVVGPNVGFIPSDLAKYNLRSTLYAVAGPWVKKLWLELGFSQCPIKVWPVGIDTEVFYPSKHNDTIDLAKNPRVMVYHKRRSLSELHEIHNLLNTLKINHFTVPYGAYTEKEYLDALHSSSIIIWHGCSETQGIAFQEAMSCNIPIIVCDATSFSQSKHPRLPYSTKLDQFHVTSAPYFSEICGIKINSIGQLKEAILRMLDTITDFNPRTFVQQNLSLTHQAHKLVSLWEYWDLTIDSGLTEQMNSNKPYTTPHIIYWHKIFKKFRKY